MTFLRLLRRLADWLFPRQRLFGRPELPPTRRVRWPDSDLPPDVETWK